MKRCPQCEFIYEDEQSLCDMDGILLVFDPQQLPKPNGPKPNRNKHPWRSRAVTTLAALVLATVLYLVYYVSTQQQSARQTYAPASTSTGQPPPASSVKPTAETMTPVTAAPKETNETKVSSSVPEVKVSKEEKAKPASNPKTVKDSNGTPKAKSTQKPQNPTTPKEEESKIGSILKKTGRILKKPFKF